MDQEHPLEIVRKALDNYAAYVDRYGDSRKDAWAIKDAERALEAVTKYRNMVRDTVITMDNALLDYNGCEINPSNYHDNNIASLNQAYVDLFVTMEAAVNRLKEA